MRQVTIHRQTSETDITITINLDGTGQHKISTGVGFLDHMLTAVSVHALFDLEAEKVPAFLKQGRDFVGNLLNDLFLNFRDINPLLDGIRGVCNPGINCSD